MKSASEVPAILTIHQINPGQYVVRVGDLRYRPLVVAVSKLLEDASSLIVITPADIKVLRVSGSAGSPKAVVPSPGEDAEAAGPEVQELQGEVPMESLDPETQAAIREQEQHSLPGVSDSEVSDSGVKPDPGMRIVRRKSNGRFSAAGHLETCGRCRGQRQIPIIDEGGAVGQAPCGVCQGSGVVTRYGAKR